MMESKEVANFKRRNVLAICWAGSDRSRLISEELEKRGYLATSAGVAPGMNYVTKEDLMGVGTVIFASQSVRKIFKGDKRLNRFLKDNQINIHVLNISESDKERALQAGEEKALREEIAKQLDFIGFKNIAKTNFAR